MYGEDEKKYKKIILIGIIVLIVLAISLFLIFSTFKKDKPNDFEKLILRDAETFIKLKNINSNHFITLADIEDVVATSYETCNKATGILYNNGKYELYVSCSNYISDSIKNINNQNYNYITLKEDAFIVTSDNKFKDPGYVSNYKVETYANSVYSTQGLYTTTYLVKDSTGQILEKANRYIVYSNYNNDLKTSHLELLGSKEMYLKKGSKFIDPGVQVKDSYGNDVSLNVKVTGNVNTNIPGVYTLNYNLNQLNTSRTVTVTSMDIDVTLSNENYTNKSVKIIINIDSNEYVSTTLPDDTISTDDYIEYEVFKNGTYHFYVKDKHNEGTHIVKEITNIDKTKPLVSCTGKSENKVTTINIKAEDNSGIRYYKYGSFSDNVNTNAYVINQTLSNLWVSATDNAGNITETACVITVIAPTEPKPETPEIESPDSNGDYKRIRLTHFEDAALAKCGTSCIQRKKDNGELKIDDHGWYMYKYKGEWYYVIASAINNPTLIDKYGHASYTDITYYNYYDTFTIYISDTTSSSSDEYPDNRYKAYRVIILDVCGACSKFSKYLQDIHPPWSSTTIEKWRSDAYKGNSIKLDLWISPDASVNPASWAFIDN